MRVLYVLAGQRLQYEYTYIAILRMLRNICQKNRIFASILIVLLNMYSKSVGSIFYNKLLFLFL